MRFLFLSGVVLLTACSAPEKEKTVGMPNPASVYCTDRGGRLEIKQETGGSVGYCHLPDGRVIEEWEFFRAGRK